MGVTLKKDAKLRAAYHTHGSNIRDLYEFGAVLGRGASSVVRCVTRKLDNEHFAMKIVRKDPDAPFLPALAAEVTVIRSCCHPSIIDLIDIYESPSRVYLLYPIIPGGTLIDAAVRTPDATEAVLAVVIAQLADACGYLHARSIVHRDLTPYNILVQNAQLTLDTVVKVSDLGHAYFLQHATRLPVGDQPEVTPAAGTAGYIAPEILRGGAVTPAADVWSIGAILYFLLTGNELAPATAAAGAGLAVPGASHAATDLVRRCLDPDPSSRITPAGILRHPWTASVTSADSAACACACAGSTGGGSALQRGAAAVVARRRAEVERRAADQLVSIAAMASPARPQAGLPVGDFA